MSTGYIKLRYSALAWLLSMLQVSNRPAEKQEHTMLLARLPKESDS